MNFFLIETSGEDSFVALFLENGTYEACFLPSLHQSKTLLPAISSLLKNQQIHFNSLAFIAVGIGPGLFTGTRIGVMTTKTLNFAKKIPLIPFCSLTRFLPDREGPFLTLLDGKSEGFILLEGEKKGEEALFSFPYHKVKKEELVPYLKKHTLLLISPPSSLEVKLKDLLLDKTWQEAKPNLPFLASQVKKRYLQGEGHAHPEVVAIY
ncbi:MAG: tRNA (adenosine(37)-N6)-threonylcarbamoyltransferase complex dimerization subunit type 1 TsaB [Simkania negevensis]|nr:tRNA (adenosine(37)-N6)-threonylcarbamoyltransferase complex dimerization subunit type 1 TsaB [Simkania negevensis]